MRELRQKVVRASNEIHRRKSRRKLTEEEHSIMKTLRMHANSKLEDEHQLKLTKERKARLNEGKKSEALKDCAEGKED